MAELQSNWRIHNIGCDTFILKSHQIYILIFIITTICPLTLRVAGAPQMILHFVYHLFFQI